MTTCLPIEGNELRIDNSGLEAIQRCPRYAWHLLCLRRTIVGNRPALDFGSAVHAGIAGHLSGASIEAQAAMIDAVMAECPPPEEEYRHAARARETVALYRKTYADDGLRLLGTPPLIEHSFSEPLGVDVEYRGERIDIVYQGRIDAAIDTGRHTLVVDHKTASRFDGENASTYWDGFVNSGQMKGYCWYLQRHLGVNVHGALINLIVVRPPLKTDRPSSKPRTEFHRREFYYTQEAIEAWRHNVAAIVQTFLHYCEKEYFPMHTFACTLYKRCQYLDVCSCGTEAQRMAVLNSGGYKDYTWTPLGEVEKEAI